MLEYFCIFTQGGALLWTFQLAALRGNPVDSLIRGCLLEQRSGDSMYTYQPPGGAPYALKWTLHNGLGLVFVAVYQKALALLWVEDLLDRVKRVFCTKFYEPDRYDYGAFEGTFLQLCEDAERRSETLRLQPGGKKDAAMGKGAKKPTQAGQQQKTGASAQRASEDPDATDTEGSSSGGAQDQQLTSPATPPGGSATRSRGGPDYDVSGASSDFSDNTAEVRGLNGRHPPSNAFNKDALSKLTKGGRGGRGRGRGAPVPPPKKKGGDKPRKKVMRDWGNLDGKEEGPLDYSTADNREGGSPVEATTDDEALHGASRMDELDESSAEELEEEVEQQARQGTGVLGGFMAGLKLQVLGSAALRQEDIQPALAAMKRRLMERNVAETIAEKLCDSVAATVVGQQLASFTGVTAAVRAAFEQALTRLLTPHRSIDVLSEIRKSRGRSRPYTIVFCGVNGVGKSTNLAKIAFWLTQNDVKVMVAACDTFRSGAIEQLRTHCARLQVPLYDRGYEKDAANVCAEALKQGQREGVDVLLVDTAGRMQDNEPLMRALSTLINKNTPDLVLFVGEALVGNDAVDQLSKFNQRLADLAPRGGDAHAIDGILLTKFDTIDDKVGAALSMVYTSGAPIIFVGVGQTYKDLKRLKPKEIIYSLLK